MSGPLDGFRPASPPPELRNRVLAAAREAAEAPAPGLLELLLADRALRICFGAVGLLLIAQLLVDRAPHGAAPAIAPAAQDEAVIPSETGFTAAEQIDELEPAL
jgi:hypothetical protein